METFAMDEKEGETLLTICRLFQEMRQVKTFPVEDLKRNSKMYLTNPADLQGALERLENEIESGTRARMTGKDILTITLAAAWTMRRIHEKNFPVAVLSEKEREALYLNSEVADLVRRLMDFILGVR